jgi:hypothetical protein
MEPSLSQCLANTDLSFLGFMATLAARAPLDPLLPGRVGRYYQPPRPRLFTAT